MLALGSAEKTSSINTRYLKKLGQTCRIYDILILIKRLIAKFEPMKTTVKDIASRAGSTPGAVSVVINGARSRTIRVSDETRRQILRAADELGYRRDLRAASLVTGRSETIGLILPYFDSFTAPDPFSQSVITGVAAGAAYAGYNVMLYTASSEQGGAKAAKLIDRRIDGMVMIVPRQHQAITAECHRQGILTVGIHVDPGTTDLTVNSDDYGGGRAATEHLIQLGHSRIAHIAGRPEVQTTSTRCQGYVDAMQLAGHLIDPDWVLDGRFERQGGLEAGRKLLELPANRRPTAFFAANDPSAHGILEALEQGGFSVPDDFSVVGYDDTWYALLTSPPLTTVSMGVESLGRSAADLLIRSLKGEPTDTQVVLPVRLVVRGTTGPAKL